MSFKQKDGLRLQAIPVRVAEYTAAADYVPPAPTDPIVTRLRPPALEMAFFYRKRDRFKELVIRDVTLVVTDYSEAPLDLKRIVPPSATVVPETIVHFNIFRKSEPLPWRFKPIEMQLSDNKSSREFKPVTVTDPFTNILRAKVRSRDPGIFMVSLQLDLISDFRAANSQSVPENPAALLFVQHSGEKLLAGAGEPAVSIKYNGEFVTSPFEPDNPFYPEPNPFSRVVKPAFAPMAAPSAVAAQVPPRIDPAPAVQGDVVPPPPPSPGRQSR